MRTWLILFVSGLLTYGIRLTFILLWGKIRVPELIRISLRYVPPAVLSAIVIPELFIREGQIDVSLGNGRMIAGIVAILIAWKFHNSLLTIIAGMVVLMLIEFAIR